jgi:hypothetical protein
MRTAQKHAKDEERRTLRWRCGQLVDAGFPAPVANALALEPAYDLHALIELTERGCPPELAVRILAPHEVT